MNSKITIEGFKKALKELDFRLDSVMSKELPIAIRAIGGFALLFHNIRTSGYTMDIDSVTFDYPPEVLACIESVAEDLELPKDWLNNYNVLENDTRSIESMLDPFWEKVDFNLKNINLWVADLETLFVSKLLASEDDEHTGRVQDFPDLLDILKKIGCTSFEDLLDYCEDAGVDLELSYPRNFERLVSVFPKRRSKPEVLLEKSSLFDNTRLHS